MKSSIGVTRPHNVSLTGTDAQKTDHSLPSDKLSNSLTSSLTSSQSSRPSRLSGGTKTLREPGPHWGLGAVWKLLPKARQARIQKAISETHWQEVFTDQREQQMLEKYFPSTAATQVDNSAESEMMDEGEKVTDSLHQYLDKEFIYNEEEIKFLSSKYAKK